MRMDGLPEESTKLTQIRNKIYDVFSNLLTHNEKKRAQNLEASVSMTDAPGFPNGHPEDFSPNGDFFGPGLRYYQQVVFAVERDKRELHHLYNEMRNYPYVSEALDEICDQAINDNEKGEVCTLEFNKKFNANVRDNLKIEFDFIMNDVIEINRYAYDYFRDFVVQAEIAFEQIINPQNPRAGIVRVKRIPAYSLLPIWEEDTKIKEFYQLVRSTANSFELIKLDKQQIAYENSGIFRVIQTQKENSYYNEDDNDEKHKNKTRLYTSILEEAKIPYRQLKQLEDSIIIYRLVRAPKRLVFNVDVGNLPKAKAEEYVKRMMRQFSKKEEYDVTEGRLTQDKNVMNMLDDFWFPKTARGQGTEVSEIGGDASIGGDNLEDLNYFVLKLYKALRVPMSRREVDNMYSIGEEGSISREEIKFTEFVKRWMKKFNRVFMEIFFNHLKLKGLVEELGLSKKDFKILFFPDNYFEEFKEARLLQLRMNMLSQVSQFIETSRAQLSSEWIFKKYLKLTDEDWEENKKLLESELKENSEDNEEYDMSFDNSSTEKEPEGNRGPMNTDAEGREPNVSPAEGQPAKINNKEDDKKDSGDIGGKKE